MQKFDLVKSLEVVVDRLQSQAIVNHFRLGFKEPGKAYNYDLITPLLFVSKSNYDQLKQDPNIKEILMNMEADKIYEEQSLSFLTKVMVNGGANHIIQHARALDLFNFHSTLIATLRLTRSLLIRESIDKASHDQGENGIVLFQISIEGEGLETNKYIKILSALEELALTLAKIYNETDEKPEIVLLDSGSDTNAALKTGVETAKSLFSIFKEIWDFILNHRFYKQAQQNKAIVESLSVQAEIKKRIDEGVITPEQGQEYMHIIKTRTDDLIGLKVLPKQIANASQVVNNQRLLEEYKTRLLTEGSAEK